MGLSIMSRHAQALGYDAVILFLDELVLWLASHAADVSFVSREGTKLVKLVEATQRRPADPAGQLRRPPARPARTGRASTSPARVQLQFTRRAAALGGALSPHHAGRPQPAGDRREARAAAGRRRRAADAGRRRSTSVLKMRQGRARHPADRRRPTAEMFRKVYPFSPALVQTLIAVSAALQRERTALKLMLQLLVDRRDDLELGQHRSRWATCSTPSPRATSRSRRACGCTSTTPSGCTASSCCRCWSASTA
ncbi:MAG: hypothetical protein MZW92_66110 [Comamonadaceae bacterium]|nr:hypothetical protein [Comamonadaceae bacterium]